jgi:hypothetical protein
MASERDEFTEAERAEARRISRQWAATKEAEAGQNGRPGTRPVSTDKTETSCNTEQIGVLSEALDWKPFPTHSLSPLMRDYVQAAAAAIGCDESAVAMSLLAACAAAIGNTSRVELKRTWSEPSVLWTCLVAESGCLKSPALELPLKPFRAKQAAAIKRHKAALQMYEEDKESYAQAMAKWRKGGFSAPEGRPAKPGEPVRERYWCSDITIAALADRLSHAPRGLLVYREELAGWMNSFDEWKSSGRGGDKEHWLTIHGARDLLVDRRGGDEQHQTIFVPHAAVSVVGGIQPQKLRRTLTREHFEDGLAARLLLTMPPRPVKRWSEAVVDEALDRRMGTFFDQLWQLKLEVDPETDSPEPQMVRLTRDAKARWIDFFHEHDRRQRELTGDLAAAWSKLEGYAARLGLDVHLARWAEGDVPDPCAYQLDERSMVSGITLSQWFGHECERVYAMLSETDAQRERRELCELMRKRGGVVSVRELMRSSSRYGQSEEAERALEGLVKAGRAIRTDRPAGERGGRPTWAYRLL